MKLKRIQYLFRTSFCLFNNSVSFKYKQFWNLNCLVWLTRSFMISSCLFFLFSWATPSRSSHTNPFTLAVLVQAPQQQFQVSLISGTFCASPLTPSSVSTSVTLFLWNLANMGGSWDGIHKVKCNFYKENQSINAFIYT